MSFSFPSNPQVGDTAQNGNVTYTWDGSKWVSTNGPLVQGSTGPIGATGATGPVGDFDGKTPLVSTAVFATEEWIIAGISTTGFSTEYSAPGTGSVAIGPIDNYQQLYGGTPGAGPADSSLMFNHYQGAPQDSGNSARLSLNSRRTNQSAQLDLAMASNVSYGTTVGLNRVAKFTEIESEFFGDVRVTGIVYGNLIGNIDGDVTGNSGTTDRLRVPVDINLAGDVAGTTVFDGSQDVTINTTIQPNSVQLAQDTTGDFVKNVTVSGGGLSVTGSGENATYNVSSNATNVATPNTLVIRDGNANFSANRIFASFTGNVTGNADTASRWQTARTLSLSGDLGGSVSIDGSQNVTLAATIQPNSVRLAVDTTGDFVRRGATSGKGISGSTTGENKIFTVTSNATETNTPNTIVFRDANGDFSARRVTGDLIGNASTADLADDALTTQKVTIVSDNGESTNGYIYFGTGSSGPRELLSDSTLRYQANANRLTLTNLTSTNLITANNINASGTITGNLSGNAASASKLTPGRTINTVLFDGTSNIVITAGTNESLIPGNYIIGSTFDGLNQRTWDINATPSNTGGAIIARNGSGTFSAGQANLSNVNASGWVRAQQGSAAGPSYRFLGAGNNNGFYSPGTNTIAASSNSVEMLRIDPDKVSVGLNANKFLQVGDGSNDGTVLKLYKKDNNVSDHLQFYNNSTRIGEIGVEDNAYLWINKETNKEVRTPRAFGADAGFKVDDRFVINGSGTHVGDGSGLEDLNATEITSGTLNKARLPASIDSDTTGNAATANRANTVDVTNTNTGTAYRIYFGGNGTGQTVRSDSGITVIPNDNRIRADWFQGTLDGSAESAITLSPKTGQSNKEVVTTQGTYVEWNRVNGSGATFFVNQKGGGAGGWRFSAADTGGNKATDIEAVRIEEDGRITISGPDKTVVADTFTGTSADSDLLEGLPASSFIRANTNDNVTGNTEWQDTFEARFGNGADMRLYHNPANGSVGGYIDNRTGDLFIRGVNASSTNGRAIRIQARSGENSIVANPDSSVQLYFNNSPKLATNTGGVTVTGRVTAGSFTGDGSQITNVRSSQVNVGNSQRGTGTVQRLMFVDTTGNKQPQIDTDGTGIRYRPSDSRLFVSAVESTFSGNGAGLTSLNATNISSGTLNRNRLPGEIDSNTTGKAATAGRADNSNRVNVNAANNSSNYNMIFTETGNGTDTTGTIYKDGGGGFTYNPSSNTLNVGNIAGRGTNLTNLNASNLDRGTVARARLSGTYDIDITRNAATASRINVAAQNSSGSIHYITFSLGRTGNQQLYTDSGLKFTPSSNTIEANLTGTASRAALADDSIQTRVTNDPTPTTRRVLLSDNSSTQAYRNLYSDSGLRFNSSSNTLIASNFQGNGRLLTNLPREIPNGTRMLFQQASPPTGWARVTSGLVTNSAFRLNRDGSSFRNAAGSVNFTSAFTSRGVPLPQHSHSGNANSGGIHSHTGTANSAGTHFHSGDTAGAGNHSHSGDTRNAGNHAHSGDTRNAGNHSHSGDTRSAGSHSHGYSRRSNQTTEFGNRNQNAAAGRNSNATTGSAGAHTHEFNTSNTGSHSHEFNTSNTGSHGHEFNTRNAGSHTHQLSTNSSNSHTHSLTINNNGTAGATMNFAVRYTDVIVASKTGTLAPG